MSTVYSIVLMIISFNQQELQNFLETIFENIECMNYSERGYRIFLFKNCLYISICHDYGGCGQARKAEYIIDRNEENQEIVLMYPSFCLEFWIYRTTTKRKTKEGFFLGDKAPHMIEAGEEDSAIILSLQGKCVEISDKIYHMHQATKLEKILKKIQGELDAGENVPLDKYSYENCIGYHLKDCLTEDYNKRKEAREKERDEWYKKRETDDICIHKDEKQYNKWEKINPYPKCVSAMTNDVDMEKAHALLEEHQQGAWKKGINIEAFVDEFGVESKLKTPAEWNRLADEEEKKRDLVRKEKEFFQTNFAFVD